MIWFTLAASLAVLAPFLWFGYRACTEKRLLQMSAIYGVGMVASYVTAMVLARSLA